MGNAAGALTFGAAGNGTLSLTAAVNSSRAVTLTGTGTFQTATGTSSWSGLFSGGGGLTKTGTGILELTNGANSYSGGTFINAGTLQISTDGNLGNAAGGVTFGAGTGALNLTAAVNSARNVTLNGTGILNATTGTSTWSGLFSGSGTLQKTGAGTLVLTDPSNSYLGGTIINGGRLQISVDGDLGNATGSVTFGAGTNTLGLSAAVNSSRNVTLIGTGLFNTTAGTSTWSGIFSGGGVLEKTGTGTLALTNASNSYSGGTMINGGTLQISADGDLGNVVGGVSFGAGTNTLSLSAAVSSARNVTLIGTGVFNTTAGTSTWSGLFSGGGGILETTGTAILALTNASNSYSGGTIINTGGTLQISSNGNLGNAGGTLTFGAGNGTLNLTTNVNSARDVTLTGTGLFDTTSGISTWSGLFSGGGILKTTGTGILELTNVSNSYSGGTTIDLGGTLQISSNGDLGNAGGAVTFGAGSGTLNLAAAVSSARAVTLTGTGIFHTTSGLSTWSGLFSGGGTLETTGTGILELSNAANSYSGGTFINAGTLQISADGDLGNVAGAVTFGAGIGTLNLAVPVSSARNVTLNGMGVFHTTPGTSTWSGLFSGIGGILEKTGTGTLVLANAANTYSGGTMINGGALQISADGDLGNVAGGVTFGAGTNTLSLSAAVNSSRNVTLIGTGIFATTAGTSTWSGIFSGGGVLEKTGTGTLALTNASNSYSGGTMINGGTLQISADGDLGNVAGGVSFGAGTNTLSLSAAVSSARNVTLIGTGVFNTTAGTSTWSGLFSGGGGILETTGTAILALTNASNSYSGGTIIDVGGTLQISSNGNLGNTAGTLTFGAGNGTLNLTTATSSGRDVVLTGTGAFHTTSGISTWLGQFTGGGILKTTGTGIFKLSNATNSYSGGTIIDLGGTLQISSNGDLGNAGGAVTFGAGSGTLSLAVAVSSARAVTLTGTGIFHTASGLSTWSGLFSGGGTLETTGTGILELSNAANSYSGGTFINAGTLQISADGDLGNVAGAVTFGAPFSTLNLAVPVSSARNVTLNGTGVFHTTPGTSTWSGLFSGIGAILEKTGTGALALTNGGNSYSGGTNIFGGALQITSPGSIGSGTITFDNNATLELLSAFGTNTIANTIHLQGDGTILSDILAGNTATFTGGIDSPDGTLTVTPPLATTVVLAGDFSGNNSLVMNGLGTLILSGDNTFTGTTTISSGRLQINNFDSLPSAGNVTDNGHLVFNHSSGVAALTGLISGTGDLTMQGAATLQLSNGGNSYSNGTNFNAGTIQVLANGALGSAGTLAFNGGALKISAPFLTTQLVTLNTTGTVQVDLNTFGVLGGAISGAGNLITQGPGTLFLSAANGYTGSTTAQTGSLIVPVGGSINTSSQVEVQLATLLVDGTVTSPILVDFGGTLAGSGTVGNATVNGIISPGNNSISTLHGSQFVLSSSSSYDVQVSDTTADKIAATTSVTINGGVLKLVPFGFTAPSVTSYTVITSPSITVNTPLVLVNPLTRYPFQLVYDPTDVRLTLTAPPTPFHVIVNSGVARCFDELIADNPTDLADIIHILDVQTLSQIAHSLNQMQPANFNNIAFAEENVAERIRQIYTNHFFEQRVINCPEQQDWRLWVAPFIERAQQSGNGSLPGYLEHFAGFSAAADYRIQKHWMLTGGFSFASTEMHIPRARTEADFKTYAATLGTAWTDSHAFADALFSYLYSPIEAKRTMHFSVTTEALTDTVNRTARHDGHSNQYLGHLGGGYDFKFKASEFSTVNLYPFVNLDYIYIGQKGYTEHGAQSLDLEVQRKAYDLLRPEGGIGVGYKGCFKHVQALFDISVSYVGQFRFLGQNTKASFTPIDCTFNAEGLKPQNNLISPSVRVRLTSPVNGFSLLFGYHGEYGKHFILNAGEAELRKAF